MAKKLKPGGLLVIAVVASVVTLASGAALSENDTPNFEAAFQGQCSTSSPCTQLCIELHDGTFECQCRAGYRLLLDGYSCVELSNTSSSSEDDSEEEWMRRNTIPNSMFHHDQERDLKSGRSTKEKVPEGNFVSEEPRALPYSLGTIKGKESRGRNGDAITKKRDKSKEFNFANSFKFDPEDEAMIYGRSSFKMNQGSAWSQKHDRGDQDSDEQDSSSSSSSEEEDDEDDYEKPTSTTGAPPDEMADEPAVDESDEDEYEGDGTKDKEEQEFQRLLEAFKSQLNQGWQVEAGQDFVAATTTSSNSDSSTRTSTTTTPEESPTEALLDDKDSFSSSDNPLTRPKQSFYQPQKEEDTTTKQQERQSLSPPSPPSSISETVSITVEDSSSEATSSSTSQTASPQRTSSSSTPDAQEPCAFLKCHNGGVCARESTYDAEVLSNAIDENPTVLKPDDGYRCFCPMGFRGETCEIEDSSGDGYSSGLFRGHSWVAFPVLHDAYMSDQISIEFRPESPNGILLLTGEREDLTGDFLALYLHSGYLEFRFDCGSGSGMVRSSQPVKLQQWNRAIISRRRWDGWMQLNDGPLTQGRSKGLFSRITFRQPVFIGGSGNISVGVSGDSLERGDPLQQGDPAQPAAANDQNSPVLSDMETESPAALMEHSVANDDGSSNRGGDKSSVSEKGQESGAGAEDGTNAEDLFAVVPFLRKMGGFQGCIRNLVINDRAYRFGLEPAGDAIQGFDVENCNDQGVCDLVHCQHGGQCIVQENDNPICLCPLGFAGQMCETSLDLQIPSFNGSSYLKYTGLGLTRVLSWLEIEVIVKPDALDGLILYNGYKTDGMGDFISLILDEGYVEFAMDLGTGAAIIRSASPISLGEWHRILVSRTSRLVSIKIDHQDPITALTPGAFTQLSLPHNLFLGGIPDLQWLSPKVKVHGGFSGCIQKLIINEKPLRIMGSAMSGVNLENCAHPCLRNPCSNGGECVPELDGFKCHCPLGYRDAYCHTGMGREDRAPKLIGDSYLKYTNARIISRISGSQLNLSFRIRTSYPRGLIVWAGRKMMTSASDFFSMGLKHGFVQATFSLGSGQTTIAYNFTTVSDGQWHLVRFVRNEQEAHLTVDDGPPVSGAAPGKLRQLNINDGLYVGGLDDPRHQSMNKYSEGLMGCMADLRVGDDYRVALLGEAAEGRNVDYCED